MAKDLYAPTEHQIQTTIINWLFIKGYYAMRLNSGRIRATNRYGQQHMLALAPAGTPDIMAFKKTERKWRGRNLIPILDLIFIEVKRPKNKPTLLQETKMAELEEHGARCIVATSVEDVEEQLL